MRSGWKTCRRTEPLRTAKPNLKNHQREEDKAKKCAKEADYRVGSHGGSLDVILNRWFSRDVRESVPNEKGARLSDAH